MVDEAAITSVARVSAGRRFNLLLRVSLPYQAAAVVKPLEVQPTDRQAPSSGKARVAGFDVIRGVAVTLVLLRHAAPGVFGGAGIVGVVMFFALSGYLITSILAAEIERTSRLDLRRFYRNRALRLLPALLVLLAAAAVVQTLLGTGSAPIVRGLVVAALYLTDLPVGNNVLPALDHLWTLAIEEQFYLIWPVLLVVATRRKVRKQMLIGVSAVVAAVGLGTLALYAHHPVKLYTSPTSWAGCLVLGATAALYRPQLFSWLGQRTVRRWATITAVIVLGCGAVVPNAKEQVLTYLIGPLLLSTASLVLIRRMSNVVSVGRGARWLAKLGTISYAVYLWGYAIDTWLLDATRTTAPWLLGLAKTSVTP